MFYIILLYLFNLHRKDEMKQNLRSTLVVAPVWTTTLHMATINASYVDYTWYAVR